MKYGDLVKYAPNVIDRKDVVELSDGHSYVVQVASSRYFVSDWKVASVGETRVVLTQDMAHTVSCYELVLARDFLARDVEGVHSANSAAGWKSWTTSDAESTRRAKQ